MYGDQPDPSDLVVLVIDSALVNAPIRYEAPESGAERFPHIYGPLPIGAVTEIREWPIRRSDDG